MSGEWGTQSRPSRWALCSGTCWRGRGMGTGGATSGRSHQPILSLFCHRPARSSCHCFGKHRQDLQVTRAFGRLLSLRPRADAGKGVASLSLLPPTYLPGPPRLPLDGEGIRASRPLHWEEARGEQTGEDLPLAPGLHCAAGCPSCLPTRNTACSLSKGT